MGHPIGDGFLLNSDAAEHLRAACEAWSSELKALKIDAEKLGTLGGFGTLGSADALKSKFEKKAVARTDSLVNALESHIAVVDDMRAYFQKCIDDATEQEQANADSLRKISPGN